METRAFERIQTLGLSIREAAAEKILDLKSPDFSPDTFNFELLALELIKHGMSEGGDAAAVASRLKKVLTSREQIKEFVLNLAQDSFVKGTLKVPGLHEESAALLREVAPLIDQARKCPIEANPRIVLKILKGIDRKLLDYVSENSDKETVVRASGGPRSTNTHLSGTNYWALNEQHKQISLSIKALEQEIQRSASESLIARLGQDGMFSATDLAAFSDEDKKAVTALASMGLIHVSSIKGTGKIYAYPHGGINADTYERIMPMLIRDQLGRSIMDELTRKYSGATRPIGIADYRLTGVPTLLDKVRVKELSSRLGLEPAHIILTLKYLESYGLLNNDPSGLSLSRTGKALGLGSKVVKAAKRLAKNKQPSRIRSMFEQYLEEAVKAVESWQVPTYELQTGDGALPVITTFDQGHFPTAKIHPAVLAHSIRDVSERKDNSLVIAGNLFLGAPAISRKKLRTSVPGLEDHGMQVGLVTSFLNEFPKVPVFHALGPIMDKTAERRAYTQALRERGLSDEGNKPQESEVRAKVERINDQKQHTQQQELAPEINDWSEFISRVVHPFEVKLGRDLMEARDVYAATGIDMNELEIVRDLAAIFISSESLELGEAAIRNEYKEFLAQVELVDPVYLGRLTQVIYSSSEKLEPGTIVSRGGCAIRCKTASGATGMTFKVVNDFNFGIRPRTSPTSAYIGYLRSKANEGKARHLEDVHLLLNTGETVAELNSLGVWVISGGTVQGLPDRGGDGTLLQTGDLFYTSPQDDEKRNRTVYGLTSQTAVTSISGGIHSETVTQALTMKVVTPKLLEVIEDNIQRGVASKETSVYVTSDWQIGSPTMQPQLALAGLIDAVDRGVSRIALNGDLRQGMNYLRFPPEAQLVENPLIALDSQAAYIFELLTPVLKYIRARKEADPSFEIPQFYIVPGNHETNTQANKGLQGTWYVNDIAEKMRAYFDGWLNDREYAQSLVICPEKFISHDGTPVDYPMTFLDYSKDFGIRIQMTHYNASGSKGSSFRPTVEGIGKAVHSLGIEEAHMRIESHMHVAGLMVRNGIVCLRTPANATGSGFEEHLNYANAPEGNLYIHLSTDDVPSYFFATRAYQETRYEELMSKLHAAGIMTAYDSFDQYCFEKRREISLKRGGNPTDLSALERGFPHDASVSSRVRKVA